MNRADVENWLILGSGGHAAVVAQLVERVTGRSAAGVVGPADVQNLTGLPHFCSDEDLPRRVADPKTAALANGVGSVGSTDLRRRVFDKFFSGGLLFPPLIHPQALVAQGVGIGPGSQVHAGAVVQTGASLGRNVVVNTGAIIEHHAVIEDHVHVASGATVCGAVTLGLGAHIGAAATILQGVEVGPRAVVGAGAVVITDVPAGATATGIPASWQEDAV